MNRPEITKEMILEAATELASELDVDAQTIADNYTYNMDGYELAKELESHACWEITTTIVDQLDCMTFSVDEIHEKACKAWVIEHDIKPPLPIGSKINFGVIKGVCTHSAARYLVKENGCTNDGRHLLIKFEDAVSA